MSVGVLRQGPQAAWALGMQGLAVEGDGDTCLLQPELQKLLALLEETADDWQEGTEAGVGLGSKSQIP